MRLSTAWVPCILVGAVALASGCGDDGTMMTTDSSVPTDTGMAPDSGTSPDTGVTPNDLVALTPCPPGWREIREENQPTVCEPWPAGGRETCDRYSAHFPGEAGCTAIGTACPTGDFEEGLATDGTVLFVKSGATGGDGTSGSPFGSITEALAGSPAAGTTVALAKGTYDGEINIPGGVTVRGACVAETHLTFGAGGAGDFFINLTEDGAALENVSVEGRDTHAVNGEWGSETSIEDVVIEGSGADGDGWGLNPEGSVFTSRNVLVRNFDVGLSIYLESADHHTDIERIVIEDTATAVYGTIIDRGATFRLVDSSIVNTTVSTIELDTDNGNTEITRTVIEHGAWMGVYAINGGILTMTDVVIRDIESDDMGWDGAGIAGEFNNISNTDPGLILRRVLIDRVRDAGIYVFNSILDAQQLVIRGVRWQECTDGCPVLVGASAIAGEDDGKITVDGFYVEDVAGCGVNVGMTGEVDLTNGDIRRATVGACIRGDGYDANRLTDGVRYLDNMSMLDATGLPVPSVDGAGSL